MQLTSSRFTSVDGHAGLAAYDPDFAEAAKLERALGVPVLRHTEKKPAGSAQDVCAQLQCAPHEVAMVGDRYITDVLFATRNGMLAVRVAPFTTAGEAPTVRAARRLELAVVRRCRREGLRPVAHPLLDAEGNVPAGIVTDVGEGGT